MRRGEITQGRGTKEDTGRDRAKNQGYLVAKRLNQRDIWLSQVNNVIVGLVSDRSPTEIPQAAASADVAPLSGEGEST
jgi:hypothetical protein